MQVGGSMEGSCGIGSDSVRGSHADGEADVFMCSICMEPPTNSVVTRCGHMFCWPCLHGWLQNQDKPCPVCKVPLKAGSITPIFGCQSKGSSSGGQASTTPPRPSAPAGLSPDGGAHVAGERHLADRVQYLESVLQSRRRLCDYYEHLLREHSITIVGVRAHAAFRELRWSEPPSSVVWIAEAWESFNPTVTSPEATVLAPTDDLHGFVFGVLVPQGAYLPGFADFQRSWLPYYEALNPWPVLSSREHYDDFLESWVVHFHRAWKRAGRPACEPPTSGSAMPGAMVEVQVSVEECVPACAGESEGEGIDATEYERSLKMIELRREWQFDRGSRRRADGRERRAHRRRRPY